MSYDINVLVNGNRCKQYFHKGRTFIEAKEGSEYVVEIKNNSWEKVLAVVSVDGLNVVDGKAADENGAGYVLDKYTAQKLYGFQYSPEKVASFKFGAFGAVKIDPATGKPEIDPQTGKEIPLGYAASKGDGSEKNAGVIGVRIWDEVPKPPPPPPPPNPAPVWQHNITGGFGVTASYSLGGTFAVSSSFSCNASYLGTGSISTQAVYSPNPQNWNAGGLYGPGRFGYSTSTTANANTRVYPTNTMGNLLKEAIADAKAVRQTALANTKGSPGVSVSIQDNSTTLCCSTSDMESLIGELEQETDKASFDMETQWGASRSYKVKETEFERREVIHRVDIYYASRESLIAMGIDLGTERRVSFPESFKESKYAKPPKGWKA